MKKKIFISISVMIFIIVMGMNIVYAENMTPTASNTIRKYSPAELYNFIKNIQTMSRAQGQVKLNQTDAELLVFMQQSWWAEDFKEYFLDELTQEQRSGLPIIEELWNITDVYDEEANRTNVKSIEKGYLISVGEKLEDIKDDPDIDKQPEGTYVDNEGNISQEIKRFLEGRTPQKWYEYIEKMYNKIAEGERKIAITPLEYETIYQASEYLLYGYNREIFLNYLVFSSPSEKINKEKADKVIYVLDQRNIISYFIEGGINTPGDKDNRNPTLADIIGGADGFLNEGTSDTIGETELQNMSNLIYNILLTLGIIIAVVVGGFLGIKSMTEGIEGKAEVKQMLVPYVVGCVILFGAFTIWKIVLTILQ